MMDNDRLEDMVKEIHDVFGVNIDKDDLEKMFGEKGSIENIADEIKSQLLDEEVFLKASLYNHILGDINRLILTPAQNEFKFTETTDDTKPIIENILLCLTVLEKWAKVI